MKKVLLFTTALLIALSISSKATAAQEKVNIHVFWAEGCPHCTAEKEFLDKWQAEDPTIEVHLYELSKDKTASELFAKVGKIMRIDASGVPLTIIGNQYISGYLTDDTHGKALKETAELARKENWLDVVTQIKNVDAKPITLNADNTGTSPIAGAENLPEEIHLPLIGNIKTKNLSLPVLTFVIALADGFNPCAMWILLFLISLLLGMQDKKRMWLLGSTFIAASGLVYFLFLAAWLNIFLFTGYIVWVRMIIGAVALFAGYQYLRDYMKNKDSGCKVVGNNEKRQQIFEKLKRFVLEKNLLLALGGIALLAFAVNIVELFCSMGLPAVYTKVLTLADLPIWQYYLYLLFYIVVFMLDDLIIFVIAMTTLSAVGIQGKYARISHLIGGILMVIIGLLMLFKPEVLMFG